MKKRIIGLLFGSLALSIGTLFGAINLDKEVEEVSAYYTPSTHYEVSDTASELASYYSSISDSDTGTSLLSKLQSLNSSKRKRTIGYSGIGTDTSGAVIYTDYDLNSTAKDSNGQTYGTKVASFYTKTAATGWNREHMWPNSHGGNHVEADILHTRPTISSENSSRGNSFYVEGKNNSSSGWDPYTAGYDAEVRGECARVILYCVVAYPSFTLSDADSHSTSNSNKDNMMGNMNTLIKWHFDYAPNVYEMNRNNGAEYLQGNRNPFVDHPEYVARIWSNFNSTVSTLCSNNSSKYEGWEPGNYCNYGSNTPVNNDGVTISASSASVSVGSTTTLSATASNSGTISWTTSNSAVASISSSSGASITVTGVAAGTATITAKATINGTQYSKTCTVTVTKVVSSLSKGSTSPSKTTYTAGESFDPSGLTITATYSDSTSGDVTSSVVWTPDPLTTGTTSVTGTFGGKSITISGLTVNAPTEPEIIDSNSDLSVGDYVVLRTAAGVGVTGWNNNKDATVSETESEWKKYYVASASSSGFTLKDETANNFIASPGSSNQFTYGSAATCSTDSSGHLICNNRYLCKNGTNYRFYSSISSYLPFFIYKVPATSAKTLSSISIATAPSKTTYTEGEYFDPTGLVITRTYSDSTSDTYTYSGHTSEFTFAPSTSTALTTSNTSVTITYNGKSTSQAITVNAAAVSKTLSSISISGQKTSFTIDESFSFGGTVTAHFSDSSSSDVTSSATFSGYDMSVAGNYTVTVSYTYSGTTKTTTYSITVAASGGGCGGESGSQRISASTTSTYYVSGDICPTGSTSSATADCDAFTVSWLKNSGSNSIAYTYAEMRIYASHSFTITPKEDYTITSVVITANSTSYANAVGGSSLTNCTKNVSSSTVTLTPTDGTNAVGFTNTAQSRLNYIVVEYEYSGSGSTEPTLSSITLNTDSVTKNFTVGNTFTYSGLVVTAHYSDSSYETISSGYTVSTPDMSSAGNKTVTVTYSGQSASYQITVSAASLGVLTASLNEERIFYVGEDINNDDIHVEKDSVSLYDEFLLEGSQDYTYTFTYEDAPSGGAIGYKTFEITDLDETCSCSLTVQVQRKPYEEGSGSSSLSVTYTDLPTTYQTSTTERTAASGVKFIAYNLANYSSKMQFKASGGYFQTTESMNLKSLTINNRETNALTVYGSTNGTSFSQTITGTNDVYDLTGYNYVKVMKNGSGAAYCASLTIEYESNDETAINISNYIMYEDTENQCNTKLDIAIGYLNSLSESELTTFQSSDDYVIATARERLEAWAASKGKTIIYTYGNVVANSLSLPLFDFANESISNTLIIVLSSLGVVGLIGSYFYIRKRKEKE